MFVCFLLLSNSRIMMIEILKKTQNPPPPNQKKKYEFISYNRIIVIMNMLKFFLPKKKVKISLYSVTICFNFSPSS